MHYVQLGDLRLGRVLASGSQGEVYELLNDPGNVLKLYKELNGIRLVPDALDELVRIGHWLVAEGRPISNAAAWPVMVVLDGARTAGFLMPRISEPFMVGIGQAATLAELGLLTGGKHTRIGTPGPAERVLLLRELAATLDALHQHNLVFGDLSPRNIAWAVLPTPRIMLLDCDGIRRTGHPGVLPPAETRAWEDPHAIGHPPTLDKDRYKLAMTVLRVLTSDPNVRPGQSVNLTNVGAAGVRVQPLASLLARAGGPVGTRPAAAEWAEALDIRGARVREVPLRLADATAPAPASRRRPFRLTSRRRPFPRS